MDYDDFKDDSALVYVACDVVVALAFLGVALLAAAVLIGLGLWIA